MSRVYIALGKNGDIINILPILHRQWLKEGVPQKLVVAQEFIGLVSGLYYVQPISFRGQFDEIERAIIEQKRAGNTVVPLGVHGKNFPFQKKHHSFAIDQWDRAGMADMWGKIPLQIDAQQSPADNGDRIILFGDHSLSSPFFQREQLHEDLVKEFPDHKVIRLSTVRVKDIKEFVAIYNRSDLLVTVETVHAHLSAAAKCPVIILATDKPSIWHGTPQRKGLAFHCRYSEYDKRKDELMRSAKSAVNKIRIPAAEVFSTFFDFGYNMSMIRLNGEQITTYRFHPDRKNWKTRMAICPEREFSHEIKMPDELMDKSIEDGRLFVHRDKLHLAFTISQAPDKVWQCVQAYGELEKIDGKYVVNKFIIPRRAGNDFSRMEKNWVPFSFGDRLMFIYGVHLGNQIVIEVDGEKVVREFKSPAPQWGFGEIRGGSIVPGTGIRFFHSKVGDGHKHFHFRYHLGATEMRMEPPFETISVSKLPIVSGNEEWTACEHWKPNCILPYGAIKSGGKFEISVGMNDCRCGIVTLNESDLNL